MTKNVPTFDQDRRTARALREVRPDYLFTEHDGSLICEGPNGAYLVDPIAGTCTCGDWEHRASKTPGAACKHLVAVRHLALEAGRDLAQEARQRRQAEVAARRAAEREAAQTARPQWSEELTERVFG